MKPISEKLRKLAYREAAALLASDCDSADLAIDEYGGYTEEEASLVREFIRKQVVYELRKKGES